MRGGRNWAGSAIRLGRPRGRGGAGYRSTNGTAVRYSRVPLSAFDQRVEEQRRTAKLPLPVRVLWSVCASLSARLAYSLQKRFLGPRTSCRGERAAPISISLRTFVPSSVCPYYFIVSSFPPPHLFSLTSFHEFTNSLPLLRARFSKGASAGGGGIRRHSSPHRTPGRGPSHRTPGSLGKILQRRTAVGCVNRGGRFNKIQSACMYPEGVLR